MIVHGFPKVIVKLLEDLGPRVAIQNRRDKFRIIGLDCYAFKPKQPGELKMKTYVLTVLFIFGCSVSGFAHEMDGIKMHEHMADMHKKAAECLKGGKTEKECHEAMMTEC